MEHVKWRQVCPDFLVRTFKVTADNEERTICQFHYTTWPDHGVPSSVQPILELVRLMRDVQSSESRPILVHCSAGCGRTGTLCSIDYVWALLRTGKLRDDFSLFDIISDMRRQRIAMVQTVEQYMLCYKAVATLFEQHLKLIDSHTYENVDDDGEPLGIKDLTTQEESSASSESLSTTNNELGRNQSAATVSNAENSDTESSINNSVDLNESFNQNDLCDEIKPHEKLIGKATVIRRPSISKLKAIFDNPNSNNNNNQSSNSSTNRSNRLQRSQSIKENFRNFNFNFHLEINQPKNPNRKSKSYTLSAAKLSVYKKNVSFANLVLNQEKNSNVRTKVTDINFISKNETNIPSTSDNNANNNNIESLMEKSNSEVHLLKESKELNHPSVISNTCLNPTVRFNSRPPSLNESTRSAPPKPPRTYQHVVDDSCIIKTSEGRLIVTVAQPRLKNNLQEVQNNSNQPESIYEQLGARKYSYQSSPNLAITDRVSYFPTGHSSSFHVPQQQINYRDNYGNSNVIYNQMLTKSFPISMYPPINANQPPKNNQLAFRPNEYSINDNYSPFINVLSNQHFQNHQAKPIVLQHTGYYEPIYGTTNHNQFINHPTSSNIQIIQPLNRSKSIMNRIPNPVTESIYSNREMCFNESHVAFDNSIPIPVKENIYSEIQNTPKNTAEQNELNTANKDNVNIKNGSRFNKFCKAFKLFRNRKGSQNVSSTYSKSNNINQSNNNVPANNNNTGTIVNVPVTNSLKISNGVPINPINGKLNYLK